MILVTLGTQDKDFSRLLKAVEKEIKKGTIKEKVIVQAGYTKYQSEVMEIFDFIPMDELEKLTKKADLVITHGGVGSIITALKYKKKIIAAARLKKYKEHTNDHQKQIIEEFAKNKQLLELKDFNALGKLLKKAKSLNPKEHESNQGNMIHLIEENIEKWEKEGKLNQGRKFREIFLYLIFGGLTTFINIISYFIFTYGFSMNYQVSNVIAWVFAVLFAFVTNKLFVFESVNDTKKEDLKEMVSFFSFRILSLGIDMLCMYIMIQCLGIYDLIAKVVSNILVIISNYIFSKVFIFKKDSIKNKS